MKYLLGQLITLIHVTLAILKCNFTEPYPPPLNIHVEDIAPQQLTFSWIGHNTSCDTLHYNIMSRNCGNCPTSSNSTSVTCTNVIVKENVSMCSLAVQTVVCNNIVGKETLPVVLKLNGNKIILNI